MMNRKKKILVIDTETCGDISHPLPYDIGAHIVDLDGHVYEAGSWVVYETYAGQRELMKSAYYAEKLPQYEIDLANGKRVMKKFFSIRKILMGWLAEYDVDTVAAYNTNFDIRALNNLMRFVMNNRFVRFFPKSINFIDIWTMAVHAVCGTAAYQRNAYEEDWFSDKGNVRTNAECVFSFISGNIDFVESHTALEDVEIESAIMLYCWKKTKATQRGIVGNPWRIPQKEWKYREARKDGII